MKPFMFDILIAAIVVIATLRGRSRGLVLTLCGLLTIFVAFIGAYIISEVLDGPVADLLFPLVERTVLAILDQSPPADTAELPLTAVLETLHGIPVFAGLADMFQSALDEKTVLFTGSAVFAVALYISQQLARILLFIAAFIAVLIAWWIMSHALDLAFRLPILNFLNRLGGLVLGFGQGIALCLILCWLFRDSYLTADMIDGSFLLPYFCSENPLTNIPFLNS